MAAPSCGDSECKVQSSDATHRLEGTVALGNTMGGLGRLRSQIIVKEAKILCASQKRLEHAELTSSW